VVTAKEKKTDPDRVGLREERVTKSRFILTVGR